jgi:small-conductance mechanosensitive channel
MTQLNDFFDIVIVRIGNYQVKIDTIIMILLILIITKLISWLIKKALFRNQKQEDIDTGNLYSIYQIVKYIIWVIAIALMLDTVGIKLTVLLAGSAALLVGIGLGLKQTFDDIISGIILLTERSIKVGDVLEIDDDVVKILKIGLRTSLGLDRDEIAIIIPNSLITTNKVVNWSHQSKQTRFKIDVGIAYGSDVDLVMRILKESAVEHPDVTDKNSISVRFLNFGNSSLDFQVLFYSQNIFRIERVKSDIRIIINRKLLENKITIPFPQIDVHVRND